MARLATIIGTAADIWTDLYEIREARPTPYGFDVLLGWPAGRRGQGGVGGPRVVVAGPLAGYMERHRATPAAITLPIGRTAVKRVRRLLGHNWLIDNRVWWEDRIPDLIRLSARAFAEAHHVAEHTAAVARIRLLGTTQRPAYWWRDPGVVALLSSDLPIALIADALSLSVSSTRRLVSFTPEAYA